MNQINNFEPWELRWQGKHIQRFWDWQGRNPAKVKLYFSNLVGDAILDEVNRYVALKGIVVDWGAGPGFLVEKLLNRGIDTFAVDTSVASIEILTGRFGGQKQFLGAEVISTDKFLLKDQFADMVILIETVEHLDDVVLSNVLSQIDRILKPGGIIIITTPNEEDLQENQVMCPDCGCIFHTVQHVRSLSPKSLSELMSRAGFTTVICKPTLFSWHPPFLRILHVFKFTLKREKFPHLLYIGKKKEK